MIVLAWIASISILAAFVAVQKWGMRPFDITNAVGSVVLVGFAWHQHAYPNAALSAAWGVVAIIRLLLNAE